MEATFKLSNSAIEGIGLLNGAINEEITRKLIVNAVKQILVNGPGKIINIKLCLNSLITFFFFSITHSFGYL
jgi:hypothetical protein